MKAARRQAGASGGPVTVTLQVALSLALIVLSGCVAADAVSGSEETVAVRYATDRSRDGVSGTNFGYDDGRGELGFGIAEVSIPAGHIKGRLEAPPLRSPAALADRRFHVYLASVRPVARDAFVAELRGALGRSRRNEILIFVHGYNTDFGLALRRTAQLRVDLDFAGVAVAFSWPSAGRATSYVSDQNNADWAAPDLAGMLRLLVGESGADRVHLLVHSMGSRILLHALDELERDHAAADPPLFAEVIFAAPDVDSDIFAESVPRLQPLARRFTLYASDSDMAMLAARRASGGYPRAGDSSTGAVVLPGMDTVDASAVRDDLFGHEYFGESPPVLDDIRLLLRAGVAAADRPRMARASHRGRSYWRLLPPES
jgi:esterase/lipase superfamily enzyme